MENSKVFTKTNLILSAITIIVFLLKFFECLMIANSLPSIYTYDDMAVGILIFLIYTMLFAYLSRLVGVRKGIENGYIWGLFLGILGFIVVCALQGNQNLIKKDNTTYKYEDLERLQKLKDSGTITNEEFETEKRKILK